MGASWGSLSLLYSKAETQKGLIARIWIWIWISCLRPNKTCASIAGPLLPYVNTSQNAAMKRTKLKVSSLVQRSLYNMINTRSHKLDGNKKRRKKPLAEKLKSLRLYLNTTCRRPTKQYVWHCWLYLSVRLVKRKTGEKKHNFYSNVLFHVPEYVGEKENVWMYQTKSLFIVDYNASVVLVLV
jgi:hypothetical protein